MSKTPQNNTPHKKQAKRMAPSQDTDMQYAFKTIPISKAFVDKMIEELKVWPDKHPENLTIRRFYLSKGLSSGVYYSLLKRHPELRETHEEVMGLIGDKIWSKHAWENWSAAKHRLFEYGPEYVAADTYHAELKSKFEDSSKGDVRISFDSMPIEK